MNQTDSLRPPPTVGDVSPKSLENAKRQFVELYGSSLVLNTYLKIALLLVSLIALGLIGLNYRTQHRYADIKPLVIRIDAVGRAEAVDYDAATYKPEAPELRYFLSRFITTHYSRLRTAVQRDYPDSLFFLEPTLADATIAQNERAKTLETFLSTPSADEIGIDVRNVTLSELNTPPYKAAVDFDMRYYAPGTRQETKRHTYVAQIDFVLRDAVPNAFVRVNPLGLLITHFRIDQAFTESRP